MNRENTARLTLALNQHKAFQAQCEEDEYTDPGDMQTVTMTLAVAVELALGNDGPDQLFGLEVNLPVRDETGQNVDNWVRITPTCGAPYVFDTYQGAEDAARLVFDRNQPWLYRICDL